MTNFRGGDAVATSASFQLLKRYTLPSLPGAGFQGKAKAWKAMVLQPFTYTKEAAVCPMRYPAVRVDREQTAGTAMRNGISPGRVLASRKETFDPARFLGATPEQDPVFAWDVGRMLAEATIFTTLATPRIDPGV
ncbi:hypothetical protein BDZ89DRAFT_1158834 [Hymenopellis radicata]|nr:hypothetical protein BDZ89DRAFT_1158834 [Hymenopellis radicata]